MCKSSHNFMKNRPICSDFLKNKEQNDNLIHHLVVHFLILIPVLLILGPFLAVRPTFRPILVQNPVKKWPKSEMCEIDF